MYLLARPYTETFLLIHALKKSQGKKSYYEKCMAFSEHILREEIGMFRSPTPGQHCQSLTLTHGTAEQSPGRPLNQVEVFGGKQQKLWLAYTGREFI